MMANDFWSVDIYCTAVFECALCASDDLTVVDSDLMWVIVGIDGIVGQGWAQS